MREAIKLYDFSVIEGHRAQKEQDAYFESGASKVRFPHSFHNKVPSLAIDIVPYPIDWKNLQRFRTLAEIIKDVCEELGEEDLKWGYDKWGWDMPHWQLEI